MGTRLQPPDTEIEEDGHELRMGLFEHLAELRDRLLRSMLVVVLGAVLGFIIAGFTLEYLIQPYSDLYPEEGRQLVILGPTGAIVAYLRVSLMVGGIVASPIVTYQILMFIIPGLTRRERRYLLRSLPAITGLFLIGVAFAWFVLIPPAVGFLEGFQSDIFQPEWTADQYLSFVTALLFWMGVAFEIPLVLFVLSLLGLVTARALMENWRVAIIGAAVAAAFITPTVDPVNMFLVMGPLLGLYLFSILLVTIGSRMARQ